MLASVGVLILCLFPFMMFRKILLRKMLDEKTYKNSDWEFQITMAKFWFAIMIMIMIFLIVLPFLVIDNETHF